MLDSPSFFQARAKAPVLPGRTGKGDEHKVDTALMVFAALLLDGALGEPRRFHPLVGFGYLATKVEKHAYRDSGLAGLLVLLFLLLPFIALAIAIQSMGLALFEVVLLYLAIGWRSLDMHAERVGKALSSDDLPAARRLAGEMLSRDTTALDSPGVAGACIESLLENGNDAIFGAIFWFVVAGLPGVVLYRLSNTLDAMWGYRTERYRRFGRAAARLDDLLNVLPARLTALSYALLGRSGNALRCWRKQGGTWKSPNAGPVMAAGAGSLGLQLGGKAIYDGVSQNRSSLGSGEQPRPGDIDRTRSLIGRTVWLWASILLAGGWFASYFTG